MASKTSGMAISLGPADHIARTGLTRNAETAMTEPDKSSGPDFCVLVPALNEAKSLPELVDRVSQMFADSFANKSHEILIIDDGSTDDTWNVIETLAQDFPTVRGIRLRRNCGKSMAIMIGFRASGASIIITMDADLQDLPEDVPALIARLDEGADLVTGWRQNRQDQSVRKLGSRLYNATVRWSTGLSIHDFNCGLKAYRRDLAQSLVVYGHYHRYMPVMAQLVGFKVAEVPVGNVVRKHGGSRYRSFRYEGFFDLLSLLFTHRYGLNPLHFFGVLSLVLMVPAFLVFVYLVGSQFMYWIGMGDQYLVANRPLLSISLNFLLFGAIIFLTGFVCDFVLHHQIRQRMSGISSLSISSTVGGGRIDAGAESGGLTSNSLNAG
ncbi:MAG: glycosyltransferase [Gammaproteobacteria bacterium]|nr:glycosyltransferase [Gammaproteobacteria bacterium]